MGRKTQEIGQIEISYINNELNINHLKAFELTNSQYSDAKKFLFTDSNETKKILVIMDRIHFKRLNQVFDIHNSINNIYKDLTNNPTKIGLCNDNSKCYMLLDWIEGIDLNIALKDKEDIERFSIGKKTGEALCLIKNVPIQYNKYLWRTSLFSRILYYYNAYKKTGIRFKNDEIAFECIDQYKHLILYREPALQHGDFLPKNIILTPKNEIKIIDLHRFGLGDPYKDFYKTFIFCNDDYYWEGLLSGYFHDTPKSFYQILSLFCAYISFYSIVSSCNYAPERLQEMIRRAETCFTKDIILSSV